MMINAMHAAEERALSASADMMLDKAPVLCYFRFLERHTSSCFSADACRHLGRYHMPTAAAWSTCLLSAGYEACSMKRYKSFRMLIASLVCLLFLRARHAFSYYRHELTSPAAEVAYQPADEPLMPPICRQPPIGLPFSFSIMLVPEKLPLSRLGMTAS